MAFYGLVAGVAGVGEGQVLALVEDTVHGGAVALEVGDGEGEAGFAVFAVELEVLVGDVLQTA